jgi:hypothetical protein
MECEGCRDFPTCIFLISGSFAINCCPCNKCIIKTMCNYSCEDMKNHYEYVFPLLKY